MGTLQHNVKMDKSQASMFHYGSALKRVQALTTPCSNLWNKAEVLEAPKVRTLCLKPGVTIR